MQTCIKNIVCKKEARRFFTTWFPVDGRLLSLLKRGKRCVIVLPCAFTCWEVRVKLCPCHFSASCSTLHTCKETNFRVQRQPEGGEVSVAPGSEKRLRTCVNTPRACSQEGQELSRGDYSVKILGASTGGREHTALGLSPPCPERVADLIPPDFPSQRHESPLCAPRRGRRGSALAPALAGRRCGSRKLCWAQMVGLPAEQSQRGWFQQQAPAASLEQWLMVT